MFSGLHGVLPAVSDISHQQNLPVTEHPAAACPDDVQLHPVPLFQPLPVHLPLRKMVAVFLHHPVFFLLLHAAASGQRNDRRHIDYFWIRVGMISFSQYFVQIFSYVCGDNLDPNWCFFYGRNHDGAGIIQPARHGDEFVAENRKGWFDLQRTISSTRLACAG